MHTLHSFQVEDDLNLSWQQWLPETPKATLFIAHGYAEHAGRYDHFARFLVKHGYAVYALDHRGHGQSQGERANIGSFENFSHDLSAFIEHIASSLPCFLLGHSMGGVIAAQYVLEYQANLKGLILSAPFLQNATKVPALLLAISGLASRYLPSLATTKLDSKLISRDPKVVKAYEDDPLVYTGGTKARLGSEMLAAGPKVIEQAHTLSLPILLLHGTADQIASPEGSKRFFAALTTQDKTFKTYEGYFHEILNELGKEKVYNDILDFLSHHLP